MSLRELNAQRSSEQKYGNSKFLLSFSDITLQYDRLIDQTFPNFLTSFIPS